MQVGETAKTPEDENLSVYIDDQVAIITLNRPKVRNAINADLARALELTVQRIETDPGIRIAVITGAGNAAFCAGADLREVAAGRLDDCFTTNGGFAGLVDAPRTKPWIAAVNGSALAGGFEIVLACDLVVAAPFAQFGLPEVKRGLIASAGGLYRLPRSLPKAVAIELIVTGNTITASRAYELGLVNRIAEDGDVMTAAKRLAHEISTNAPLAVAASLKIARAAAFFIDDPLKRAGHQQQATLQKTRDYQEGAKAFLEKRTPNWTAT